MSQAQRIGQFIRAYREKLNLSQEELAKRADLPADTIRRYEAGRHNYLYQYTAGKLADALELPKGSPERETFLGIARAKAPLGGKRGDPRNRLIAQVRSYLIDGVLDQHLQGIHLIALRTFVERTTSSSSQPTEATAEAKAIVGESSTRSIHDVFASVRDTLLICGQAGSGKTVVMLDLARQLLEHAGRDALAPIPVVLSLASWAENQLVLEQWIIDELEALLGFREHVVFTQLLEAGRIVLLLDGLDDVRPACRVACVEAINAFSRTYTGRLVVCCRSSVYETLDTKLAVDATVTLQPLDDEQIKKALSEAGRRLAALYELLWADAASPLPSASPPRNMLRGLASSPLMLGIMIKSFDGVDRDNLALYGSLEAQKRYLLESYLTRMLGPRDHIAYTANQTREALGWLAQQLQRHDQTLFYLDQVQPSWLPSPAARRLYHVVDRVASALLAGLVLSLGYASTLVSYGLLRQVDPAYWKALLPDIVLIFLIGGFLGGLFGGHPAKRRTETRAIRQQVRDRVFGWVCGGLLMGTAVLLVTKDIAPALMCSLIGALAGLLMNRPTLGARPINLVEERAWSWTHTLQLLPAYLSAGMVVGIVIGLFLGQVDGLLGRLLPPVAASVTAGLLTGVLASVIFGVTYRDDEAKATPNQGIWRSGRNALRSAVEGAIGGALFGLLVMSGPVSWLITALIGGLLGAVACGAITVISHVTLRLILWQQTPFPLRSVRFLNYAVERGLLQSVGAAYQFQHVELRNHIARDSPTVTQERPGVAQNGMTRRTLRASHWYEVAGFVLILGMLALVSLQVPLEQLSTGSQAEPNLIIDPTKQGYAGTATASIDINPGDTVVVTASGFMSIGAFSRHVSPAGAERGGLGLPLGDDFKREPNFPAGALLCRITDETRWRLCGEQTTFVASKGGSLEFLVNNVSTEKHAGSFLVNITVVTTQARTSYPILPALAKR